MTSQSSNMLTPGSSDGCQREQGVVRKGQFVVEGYLDEEALGQHAEERTFYGHASYYGANGNDSLNCIVTEEFGERDNHFEEDGLII